MPAIDPGSDLIPSDISKAGRFLVIREGSFSRVGISSNVYVTNIEGRHYLIDAGGDPELIRYLEPVGIGKGSLGGVILTHGHHDHVRGVSSIPEGAAPVFLSDADRGLAGDCLGKRVLQDIGAGKEILTLLGLETVKTPGHTPGSVCLYSRKERLLISGDTVFSEGFFGRTDLPGGNDGEMMDSLKRLSGMEIEAILPGHGEPILRGGSESVAAALENACYLLRV